jgi:hypothetical protein
VCVVCMCVCLRGCVLCVHVCVICVLGSVHVVFLSSLAIAHKCPSVFEGG